MSTRRQRSIAIAVRRWRRNHPAEYARHNKVGNYALELRRAGIDRAEALVIAKEIFPCPQK